MFQIEEINASDAKRTFGELLLKSQHAPVGVNKNGKLAAVMISANDYEEFERLKEESLKRALELGIESAKEGRIQDGPSVFEELKAQL